MMQKLYNQSQNQKDKISTGAKGMGGCRNVGVVLVLSDSLNYMC